VTEKSSVTQSQIDMLGTVAHDLKTPVAAIKSYADLIQQTGDLNETQERYLQRIYTVVDNMTELINDLLDLVWVEGGMKLYKAPCNLLDVIRAQISAFEGQAREKQIELHLSYDNDLTLVQADERRLGQVIGNLISNSIKYSHEGGNIWIHVGRLADALEVTIHDEGMGIAPEDLPHIFERFYRARQAELSRVEGSGLGLAITKAIVERHGGRITAESEPGRSSTFRFTVPIQDHTH